MNSPSISVTAEFSHQLILWQQQHGRHDLPWQNNRDPYRVWLSEIMLQQTQVSTVIPYYQRFLQRFPDVAHLATATLDDVLQNWSGLGYYSRARNLHATAQRILCDFNGQFPEDQTSLMTLPGIGRSTSAAILAFCFAQRVAILDGNVKRVLTRQFGISGYTGERQVETTLWRLAEKLLPEKQVSAYTQALMDLGALVCTRHRPQCNACPVAQSCVAKQTHQVGSLPTPKPRRVVPQQSRYLVTYTCEDKVYLTQRPATGIWAKLWCLPDYAAPVNLELECIKLFGVSPQESCENRPFRHTLTHRHLDITPVWVKLPIHHQAVDGKWVTQEQALTMGIPVPVRKILQIGQTQ